jgi:ribosomal protein S18 acetylase RimI-like enzyme
MMPDPFDKLPDGYTVRPATLDDVAITVTLRNICSQAEQGINIEDEHRRRAEWSEQGFDIDTETRLIFALNGNLAAMADLWHGIPPHVRMHWWASVHPDHTGRGIGTALARWAAFQSETLLHLAPPDTLVRLTTGIGSTNVAAKTVLEKSGFSLIRHFLNMQIEFESPIPDPAFPKGLTLSMFDTGDLEQLGHVVQADLEAFRDHFGFVDRSLDAAITDWQERIASSAYHMPTLNLALMNGDQVAGYALCEGGTAEDPAVIYVDRLGVRRAYRGRGIARNLLYEVFRRAAEMGKKGASLFVDADSLTGATRLYESVGMKVRRQADTYLKVIRDGIDLANMG